MTSEKLSYSEFIEEIIAAIQVNKAKLLCAEYYSFKDSNKGFLTSEKNQKKFIKNKEVNVYNYCRIL